MRKAIVSREIGKHMSKFENKTTEKLDCME